jgi:UDP:flavonoid glycosyltransferase YjiC (YdhE family)
MTGTVGDHSFVAPQVLAELAELDVEPVAAVVGEQAALLGELPPGVRVAEDSALDLLLPTCDLLIHHGGAGSMLTAALRGVPQLTLPSAPDVAFYASLLDRSGGGRNLREGERLGDAVRELLGGTAVRETAGALRADLLSRPTPAALVPVVERLVAEPDRAPAPELLSA